MRQHANRLVVVGYCVLIASVFLCPSPTAASSNAVKRTFKTNQAIFKPMIVLIGDSITEYGFDAPHGWALQLAGSYSRRADIINRGFGGGCTAQPQGLGPAATLWLLVLVLWCCCAQCCINHQPSTGESTTNCLHLHQTIINVAPCAQPGMPMLGQQQQLQSKLSAADDTNCCCRQAMRRSS